MIIWARMTKSVQNARNSRHFTVKYAGRPGEGSLAEVKSARMTFYSLHSHSG